VKQQTNGSPANGEVVRRYEQLRVSATRGHIAAAPSRWGMVLLVRWGMASWLVAQCDPPRERRGEGPTAPIASLPTGQRQSELVGVLAELILTQYRETANA